MRCPTIDREMPDERCLGYQESGLYQCCLDCAASQAETSRGEQPETMIIQEGTMEETKECKKCKKPKPIERFSRLRKGGEKRKLVCKDCEAAYQKDRKAKKRAVEAEKVRSEASGVRSAEAPVATLHALPLTPHSEEKQAEPTPAQNETGNWKLETGGQPGFETRQEAHGQDAHATISSNQLTLDFSPYPEVLKEIKRIAHHEERPAEVQARFMLKRLLQGDRFRSLRQDKDQLGFENRVGLPGEYQPMFIDGNKVYAASDKERSCG